MMEIKELLEVSLAYYLEKLEENPNNFFINNTLIVMYKLNILNLVYVLINFYILTCNMFFFSL